MLFGHEHALHRQKLKELKRKGVKDYVEKGLMAKLREYRWSYDPYLEEQLRAEYNKIIVKALLSKQDNPELSDGLKEFCDLLSFDMETIKMAWENQLRQGRISVTSPKLMRRIDYLLDTPLCDL